MTLDAVILSTGRAGSGYIARLLTAAGVPCGHEAVYTPRAVLPAERPVESSWLALPHVEAGFDGAVFHQVRHPLAVVSSLLNGQMQANWALPFAHYQQAHLHGEYPDDPTEFAIRFVVDWNLRCELVAEETWRVEDVNDEVVRMVAHACGITPDPDRVAAALADVPTDTNRHPDGPPVGWTDELIELADRYGYETP